MNTQIKNYVTETEEQRVNRLVEQNMGLVKHIISRMEIHLPSGMDKEDLVSIGNFGLIEAARKYDLSKNTKFQTYAYIKIRGSVLDEVRKFSFGGQSILRKQKKLMDTYKLLQQRFSRMPSDEEVAKELGLSMIKFDELIKDTNGASLLSLDQYVESEESIRMIDMISHEEDHLEDIIQGEQISSLSKSLDRLPQNEKLVLSLYYEQELSLKEISLIINLSESRISQIHKKAILKIKNDIEG
ncbi:MAG: hypothetical protein A2Y40_08910 [Candidatus Margulisbacteria bacterium GWF2_35_9]|nr:MAG: hypothetical protein A2Y40_08910 [Candidatus Margulisbacteria bacterium GWF2_35_9]